MMTGISNWILCLAFVTGCVLLVVARSLVPATFSPLRQIPGPFAARFSRLWYLKYVSQGNFHKVNIKLHQQYGPVVRIAPNQFSINDPDAIKIIYGLGKGFVKSSWYNASSVPSAPFPDLFTDLNPTRHSANRRLVANLYSATSLRNMESSVDECIEIFVRRMAELANADKPFDLQFWMQCYAFDVIGQITVAKRFGLLDEGKDDGNIFTSLHDYLKYCAVVGVFHELHDTLWWLMTKLPASGLVRVGMFTADQIEKGRKERQGGDGPEKRQDFLSRTLELHEQNPEKFPFNAVHTTCITNIGAGSDTTSISLCAILHNLACHPKVLAKLRQEIDEKLSQIESLEKIPFKDTQTMPYLQACIKEGLRLHPATGLPLARVVPEGGATICGVYFPAGNVVGINTWVAHMNTDVFGADAKVYRPERWLDGSREQLSRMESYWIPFGVGSRTCIGKNISLLEINKLIPILVKKFDFSAYRPTEIKHENFWLVKQRDMMCKVSVRD